MYIEPSTVIKLYHEVPLDNTYNHTLYFESLSAQNSYFHGSTGIVKHTLQAQTYQRVEKGKMRIDVPANSLYDCNYLAFQNSAYGNKWFYAFITGVEYKNDKASEVTFEIDDMQTYLFDVDLKECFVEREHSSVDTVGSSITAEPVDLGEYVVSDYKPLSNLMTDMVVIIAIVDVDLEASDGLTYDGVYQGATLWAYNSSDTTGINTKISSYVYAKKPDAILSMYMIPEFLYPDIPTGGQKIVNGSSGAGLTVQATALVGTETFKSYTPRNKKLYTYPYNYFCVDNANGYSLPLRYEFFDSLRPVIKINGTITQPVKVIARPCSYKGIPGYSDLGGWSTLNTESITLESYPMCSWNMDTFKAWIAQNSVPLAINTIASVASENFTPGQALGTVNNIYKKSIAADVCRGNADNGNVNCASGRQQFYQSRVHVTAEYAKIIDDFFTMYGYTCKKVKVPNRSARPKWNYTKTNGCVLQGNAPVDSVRKICNIYDNGITFWKNASEVGNYSLNNNV